MNDNHSVSYHGRCFSPLNAAFFALRYFLKSKNYATAGNTSSGLRLITRYAVIHYYYTRINCYTRAYIFFSTRGRVICRKIYYVERTGREVDPYTFNRKLKTFSQGVAILLICKRVFVFSLLHWRRELSL